MDATQTKIFQSARDFDLYDEAGEAVATQILDERNGEADITPEEDENGVNGFDAMPLENAIEIQQVSKSPVFQNIFVALKTLHAECIEKSKNEKELSDFRNLHHVKGLGVEQAIGIFTAILEESEARLKSATPAERRAMGSEANTFISDLISPVAASEPQPESRSTSSVVGPPSAKVQSNTKRSQEWLAKN
jgi:hypothetical protein